MRRELESHNENRTHALLEKGKSYRLAIPLFTGVNFYILCEMPETVSQFTWVKFLIQSTSFNLEGSNNYI